VSLAHELDRFALERHAGAYATWPARSRLLDRGAPTRLALPGYALLHQFQVPGGFLLVLDDDCPHEEVTTFCLVSAELRVLSRRALGVPYGSFYLRAIEWIDARRFVADFGGDRRGFVLRTRGIPYLLPRLSLRAARGWPEARMRFETRRAPAPPA
jgi:hypothetical protein